MVAPTASVCVVPSSTEVDEGQEVTFDVHVFNFTDYELYDVDVRLHFSESVSKLIKIIPKHEKVVVKIKATAPMYPTLQPVGVSASYVDPKSLSKHSSSSSITIVVKKSREHIEAVEMLAKAQKELSEAQFRFMEAQFEGRDISQADPLLKSSESFLGRTQSLLSMNSYKLALSNASLALEHATRVKKALSPVS